MNTITVTNVSRVLIVDDEPSARQTMEMLLLREGYDMHFAANGPEALAALNDFPPDVILLDVMMPGMDGFEVCQTLKTDPNWQHVPIILVTALDSKRDLARGLDAGADDFLHKPYNSMELRARVRSMLRIKKRHDDLQEALQLREDLSNMIVHDIRNPLSSILIYCDLLEEHVSSAVGSDQLRTVRNESQRLSTFLTDMLMMAKMEHGQLVLSPSTVDMNELVRAAMNGYKHIAALKGLEMVLDLPDESRSLSLDVNLWRRVLDNLLSNAVKFSPSNGRIHIKMSYVQSNNSVAENLNDYLCISVTDEGPGIPEEHQNTIFDKFKIVASRRRDIAQVGLGLAFCKMVVDAHDGRIFVEPNEPRGSTFVIQL
ncbi:MAG: response regulator [Chloroflexi bacterium]|nr:response regulator [Chloroflexota bacterium]